MVAAVRQDHDVDDDHDQHLECQRDTEDLGGQVDLVVTEHGDHRDTDQGEHPPGDIRAAEHRDHRGGVDAHERADPELDGGVGQPGNRGGGHPGGRPQAMPDVGVEGAAVGDLAGHRRQRHGEQQHRDGDRAKVPAAPVPLPRPIASGAPPAITPSGAAAATTISVIAGTPRLPRSRGASSTRTAC